MCMKKREEREGGCLSGTKPGMGLIGLHSNKNQPSLFLNFMNVGMKYIVLNEWSLYDERSTYSIQNQLSIAKIYKSETTFSSATLACKNVNVTSLWRIVWKGTCTPYLNTQEQSFNPL